MSRRLEINELTPWMKGIYSSGEWMGRSDTTFCAAHASMREIVTRDLCDMRGGYWMVRGHLDCGCEKSWIESTKEETT